MKKIYYLQKHEVKLGDIIEYNGIKTLVTEELIELNPELFRVEKNTQPMYFKCVKGEGNYTKGRIYKQKYSTNYPIAISLTNDKGITENVHYWEITCIKHAYNCFELTTKAEWDKQELLDEAKRRYPIGTMINSKYGIQKVLSDKPFMGRAIEGTIQINTNQFPRGMTMYTPQDGWCEIIPFKFTTEDGVDIYGDMKTYLVGPNDSDITSCHGIWKGDSKAKCDKYFYYKENALAYIEKHKEKTLEDYENSLSLSVWGWFKTHEPKLYYTKILQLIADDLNDGWVANFNNAKYKKYYISYDKISFFWTLNIQGVIVFKSEKFAEKARDILGDKLEYLFN